MKNFKLTIYVLIATMTIVSCSKENAVEPDLQASKSKDRTLSNKSGFEPEDLMNFVDDVTGDVGISTDMDADNAILFTESALDFTLVNDEELPLDVHIIESEYQLYIYAESSGALKVEASDIQSMYDDL